MDNPTRWNITNSAQNIVSALIDPSKQFDYTFRREWAHTFSGSSRYKFTTECKQDVEFKAKLQDYLVKLGDRNQIKQFEAQIDAKAVELESLSKERADKIVVPDVFLLEDFDLSNLEIFNKVIKASSKSNLQPDNQDDVPSPFIGSSKSAVNPKNLHRSQLRFTKHQLKELQQTFTDYLDIIEDKLASQISNRSGDFFQVMSSVDSIMDELSLAIKSVTSLREKCTKLNDEFITPNMKSIHLSQRRTNIQSVLDRMKDLSYLSRVQRDIQLSLSTSDFVGALDSIARSRDMLNKNLTRVICLRHMESQLLEVERVIGIMMQQEFVFPFAKSFADRFSEICDRSSITLLSLLQTQAEIFVNKFHEERKLEIESLLDAEQWKVVDDIPDEFQRLVTHVVDEETDIPEIFDETRDSELSQETPLHQQHASCDATSVSLPLSDPKLAKNELVGQFSGPKRVHSNGGLNSVATHQRGANKLTYVTAGGSTYVVVKSVIRFVRIVLDYCKCAHDIQSLSAELLERLFKILQLFNSKTYQLVYSAGAIQVAGLRTITTRSLIVAQRTLKLIILILPKIQEHFKELLPDNSRLKRFDEIRLSYEDHAAKIPERVNLIVRDVINLQLQEWEAKPPVPSNQFSAVAQHLMRLHDNIQDALPEVELRILFLKINQTFKDVLIVHLERLNITSDTGPRQWLVTQELTFYKISLLKFCCFRGWEFSFNDLWTRLNNNNINSYNNSNNINYNINDNDSNSNNSNNNYANSRESSQPGAEAVTNREISRPDVSFDATIQTHNSSATLETSVATTSLASTSTLTSPRRS